MELREGYKQTEVGAIPNDWQLRPILSLVRIANGQVDPKVDPYRSMVLVAPDHIESSSGRLLKKETAGDQRAISGKYLFSKGDIVYSKIRPYLKKAFLADFDGLCSADMYPLKPANDVSSGFMLAAILGYDFSRYAVSVSVRSGMPKINRAELAEYTLAIPPTKAEQAAIANALSDADALIQSLTRLIAKKRQIKLGAMQNLLNPYENGRLKEGWVVKSLLDAVMLIHGKAHERFIVETGKYEVVNSKFVSTEGRIKKYSNENFCKAKSKDILMVLSDLPNGKALAKCFYVEENEKYAVNQRVCIYRSKKDHPKYLHYILNRNPYFLSLDDGVTQTHILNNDIKNCQLIMPLSVVEQEAFAATLSDMDADIAALETKLAKYQQIKQGMMQNLLTGRIRLVKPEGKAGAAA